MPNPCLVTFFVVTDALSKYFTIAIYVKISKPFHHAAPREIPLRVGVMKTVVAAST